MTWQSSSASAIFFPAEGWALDHARCAAWPHQLVASEEPRMQARSHAPAPFAPRLVASLLPWLCRAWPGSRDDAVVEAELLGGVLEVAVLALTAARATSCACEAARALAEVGMAEASLAHGELASQRSWLMRGGTWEACGSRSAAASPMLPDATLRHMSVSWKLLSPSAEVDVASATSLKPAPVL
eukprot:CAMPEP_0170616422 /NCGR_PEP_ID=MMETSP0224-20130122/25861_1 /TAXON_ID=285029 /ORGANISM="Togula jolla, Strain CCCM 725" /LENGTH=184 /DNA_ID=CAMNT_0010942217 /DNA_START=487 /DNA_END=1043 /DNA_ORIENTATION=+